MNSQSDALNELAPALAKAQGQLKGAAKDAKNPHFRNEYATLTSVWEACREVLSANGLSVVQTMKADHPPGFIIVVTTLLHASGQWIQGEQLIRLVKDDPQGYGSATTYARRYGLAAMVGICPADDDGNAASELPPAPNKYLTHVGPTVNMPEKQESYTSDKNRIMARIQALLASAGVTDSQWTQLSGKRLSPHRMTEAELLKAESAVKSLLERRTLGTLSPEESIVLLKEEVSRA